MLAFALILALAAHSTLAKPTGLCLYPCDSQAASSGYTNAGYTQPSGFGQMGSGFSQMGSGFGQMGSSSSGFGQMGSSSSGFGQNSFGQNSIRTMFPSMGGMGGGMTHGNMEDFGTVNVQQPSRSVPQYMPSVVGHSQRVEAQVPVQPQIDGMFTHSSGKASFEQNQGYMKIHQPGMTQTVISEPIIRPKLVQQPNPCQNYYDPCL